MAERKRVQFDFAPEAYEELSELERQLKVPTKAEVVRYGLRTLQWLVENINAGKRILVEDGEGNKKEVIFPFIKPVPELPAQDSTIQ